MSDTSCQYCGGHVPGTNTAYNTLSGRRPAHPECYPQAAEPVRRTTEEWRQRDARVLKLVLLAVGLVMALFVVSALGSFGPFA